MSTGPAEQSAGSSPRPRDALISVALVVAILLVFGQVCTFAFVDYDDNLYVTQNYLVREGLTVRGLVAFLKPSIGLWHPLTWYSHMVDVQVFGANAGGHHAMSLVLHGANTLLLFWLLRRMTGASWRSAFVAGVFALHPLHVEPVAWVSSRKDLVCGGLMLVTLAAYARYTARPGWRSFVLVLVAFVLALMGKAMAVTVPVLLLLLDWWPLGRMGGRDGAGWRGVLVEKIPLVLVAAVAAALTVEAARLGGSLRTAADVPVATRLANMPVYYATYLGKMIWPAGLAACYPLTGERYGMGWVAGSALLLAAVTLIALRLRSRKPYVLVGWLWFLVTLAPVIGLVPVGGQALADRYAYVPLIGPVLIVAWGMPDLLARWKGGTRALGVTGIVVLMALGLTAFAQARHWRGTEALFEHALRVTGNNAAAHNSYGLALLAQERPVEAGSHFAEALRIAPSHAEAHVNLGLVLAGQGNFAEAERQYRAALEVRPDHVTAHTNLGVLLAERGKTDEAIRHYQAALEVEPNQPDARNNLANALVMSGQAAEAVVHYERVLRVEPNRASTWFNLGYAHLTLGDAASARDALQRAVSLDPGDPATHVTLAAALARLGQVDEARRHAEEAVRIEPRMREARALLEQLDRARPALETREASAATNSEGDTP